ncbi:GntR family transcriptional regulator [Nocardia terpenica]|uniref:Transcriptional regulator n=1 Tax=Nocardia terpenica TaxID=455432 RepID=A0A161ZAH6_9NOCA|nr:GntR family transcriptional regulator [Nocardia terpenica]KZM76172.1 transcriptional regulator [Nocardia terpenica]NQE90360.1 GntR family transcriptional regulator [Nocardia terpenica]
MPAKYELIADELRARIVSGELRPSDRVPGEAALVEQYKVSPPTVRQALAVLRAEGLVEAKHGIGTFVRTPRVKVRRTDERYQWEKNRVHESDSVRRTTGATERDTGLTLPDLSFSAHYTTTKATDDLADAFGVPVGTKLLQRDYRTRPRGDDAPFNLSRSYLVYDMVEQNPDLLDDSNEPWPGGTQHQLFTVGIEVAKITEEVEARPPTAREASELGISLEGSAVFDLRKISIDTDGRVVEVADVILPGDRTQLVYTTQLAPWVERSSK